MKKYGSTSLFVVCVTLTLIIDDVMAATDETHESVLEIAHINDHHSHLEADRIEFLLDGVRTRMKLGGLPALAAIFNSLPQSVLKIHAGDALTGTLYHTLFKGQADAALMNTICFDVFVLGNHEFDDGDGVLQRFLKLLRDGPCKTTVLSANVIPQVGTPLADTTPEDYFKPWTSRLIDGVSIAIVGITVRNKTMLSSRPLPTTQFLDEHTAAQAAIDAAAAAGFTRVVLVTHQGYAADVAMARRLRGVDVIIGGDSHSLLGNWTRAGIRAEGPYPTVVRNADGDPVCVGQAWEYAKAVGRMRVRFDPAGAVTACTGHVTLPVVQSARPATPPPDIARHTLRVDPRHRPPYGGGNPRARFEFAAGLPPGFGTGLAYGGAAGGDHRFYAVTDRGPTAAGPAQARGAGVAALPGGGGALECGSAVFASPRFAPSIGVISVGGGGAVLESATPIRAAPGGPIATGLPPPPGAGPGDLLPAAFRYADGGGVGELPLTDGFAAAGFDAGGVDPGAVAYDAARGALWVGDGYGPLLLRVDPASGAVLRRYAPGPGARDLPAALALRRPGRGLAGLCVDGGTGRVHGVLRGPIDPRDAAGRSKEAGGVRVRDGARFVRWVEFDPATEASRVFALPVDGGPFRGGRTGEAHVGGTACLGGGRFVVVLQGAAAAPPHRARHWLCAVEIPAGATDIAGVDDRLEASSMTGAPVGGASYADVVGLRMTILLDLDAEGWAADKAGGLAVVDERTLALISDNDFGVRMAVTAPNGTELPGRDIADCAVMAASGEFIDCTEARGYGSPPARLTGVAPDAAATSLWLIRFAEPVAALFPQPARFDRYSAAAKSWLQVSPGEAEGIVRMLNDEAAGAIGARVVEVDENATRVLKQYSLPMVELRKVVIGRAGETLCSGRVPGIGNVSPNTPECVAATKEQGSAMTQVVAEALLNASKRAVALIQNAGSVRQGIVAGDITIDTVYLVLPFSNFLYELEMTGQEILDTLEGAGEFAGSVSSGSHPYAAGMRWCFNVSSSKGSRFTNIEVWDKNVQGGSWVSLVLSQTYVIATNDYLASGQDGYSTMLKVLKSGLGVNTYMDCTQVLIDYVGRKGSIESPPASDFSHKLLSWCNSAGSPLSYPDAIKPSVLFTEIKAAVGNMQRCLLLAKQASFAAASISLEQFRELYSTARFSVEGPATNSKAFLPVFASPGFILETIPSQGNLIGFAMAINTRRISEIEMTEHNATSGLITFTQIVGRSLSYQLTVFPLSKLTKNISTGVCPDGFEARITKVGAPASFACNCPPSRTCGGKIVCVISPNSGEEWFSALVPKELCVQDQSSNSVLGYPAVIACGLFLLGGAIAYGYYRTSHKGKTIVASTFQPLPDSAG